MIEHGSDRVHIQGSFRGEIGTIERIIKFIRETFLIERRAEANVKALEEMEAKNAQIQQIAEQIAAASKKNDKKQLQTLTQSLLRLIST